METVLCTGAGGYIGSVLVPYLLDYNYKVIALDLYKHRTPGLFGSCNHPNLEVVKGDCRDETLISKYVKRVDWIIPLAAIVGAPACDKDPVATKSTNWGAVVSLASRKSAKQRLIFPTTNSGYGTTPQGMVCTESTPQNPVSLYGTTKSKAEEFVLSLSNTITFRLATVFGVSPRMRTDLLVNDFVLRAMRDRYVVLYESHFRRNYIHIRDVAGAFLHTMVRWDVVYDRASKPYNCGMKETLTKKQLCERIKAVLPDFQIFDSDMGVDPDKRDYEISNERLYSTGYRTEFTLEDGIRELIKAYIMFPISDFANA